MVPNEVTVIRVGEELEKANAQIRSALVFVFINIQLSIHFVLTLFSVYSLLLRTHLSSDVYSIVIELRLVLTLHLYHSLSLIPRVRVNRRSIRVVFNHKHILKNG